MRTLLKVLKVLKVLIIILLFTYFLQPFETDCGIVSDITSARYRLSEKTQNRRLLFSMFCWQYISQRVGAAPRAGPQELS